MAGAKQNSDGSWSDGSYPHNTAITSFALLAFLSQGHLPNQGLYGPEVAKGCRFLLASARADGYLVGTRGGNMYSHAMATLALAEMWGMTGDKDIKPVLTKAVNLIVGSQNHEGGWRYEPRPTGADISVTIMQVMALRAPRTAACTSRTRRCAAPSATSNAATTNASAASRTCPTSHPASRARPPACASCS